MKFYVFIVAFIIMFVGKSMSFDDLTGQAKSNNAKKDANVPQTDPNKISVIMEMMMPPMFKLFQNLTDNEYKSRFKEPCRFEALMDIFSKLPPFFDQIALKYPTKPELIAYYSMQLASTFLVNNGSLTMTCLYNMLSLQTRLMNFSLALMDNPQDNMNLMGLMGIFMKDKMNELKQNAMMKIIDHVDKYDKNDDINTIYLFNILNVFYIIFGSFGILSNILLVILLKKVNNISKFDQNKQQSSKIKLPTSILSNRHNNIYDSKHINTNLQLQPFMPAKDRKKIRSNRRNNKISRKSGAELSSSSRTKKNRPIQESEYDQVRSTNEQFNRIVRRRYKTRLCFITIAICHSLYLLMNFIVMSQAGLAAMALKSLSEFNIACKISFFLFPPTTAYNMLHQIAIWLLFYSIAKHGRKLRREDYSDYFDDDSTSDEQATWADEDDKSSIEQEDQIMMIENETNRNKSINNNNSKSYDSLNVDDTNEEDETVSQSLTNNSQQQQQQHQQQQQQQQQLQQNHHAKMDAFPMDITIPSGPVEQQQANKSSTVQFMEEDRVLHKTNSNSSSPTSIVNRQHYIHRNHQSNNKNNSLIYNTHQRANMYLQQAEQRKRATAVYRSKQLTQQPSSVSTSSSSCFFLFDRKHRNALFLTLLMIVLCVYNSHNIFFYSLSELKKSPTNIIKFCAFDESYADYYQILSQYILPLINLFLFSLMPLLFCTIQVLFDLCFLIRVNREQTKRYEKIKDIIEWPLYWYYLVYMISQLPFAIHQIYDLINGTSKFPFVFPLFIQMKFTSKVGMVILEMSLIVIAYSSDLFIWLLTDKHIRLLAINWLNKRILCRTYSKINNSDNEKLNASKNNKSLNQSSTNNNNHITSSSSAASTSSSCNQSDSNYVTVVDQGLITNSKESALNSNHSADVKNNQSINSSVYSKKPQNINNKNIHNKFLSQSNPKTSNLNSYASSTLSSTTSSDLTNTLSNMNTNNNQSKKKSISPVILNAVKATANLSASFTYDNNQQQDQFIPIAAPNIKTAATTNTSTNLSLLNLPTIRMIDTDNEENSNELSNMSQNGDVGVAERLSSGATSNQLEKLDENEEFKKMKQISQNYEHPPSFKSATVYKPVQLNYQYSNIQFNNAKKLNDNSDVNQYRHQYENNFVSEMHNNK